MKFLEEILLDFNTEKLSKFVKSVKDSGSNYQGKEVEIIHQIRNKTSPELKTNAYHSNRKRLTNKLIDFLFTEEISHQTSDHSKINKWIETAHFLFKTHKPKQAWFLLNKAENLASKNELHNELNQTYLTQIECSNCKFATPIPEIVRKLNKNKKLLHLDEKITIGSKIIEIELQKIILKNEGDQFNSVIQKVSKNLNLADGIIVNPKFSFNFLSISRNIAKAQKTYYQFTPFVLQTYTTLKNNNSFTGNYIKYEVEILYMICHSLYRTRNFHLLDKYLTEFEKAINNAKCYHLNSRLASLKAFTFCFTGQLDKAIKTLEDNDNSFSTIENITININLSLLHFLNKNYSSSLKTNRKLNHTNKWLEKNMGLEWVMKKNLMEIIIHIELENISLVESLIRSFETKFKTLLTLKKYERVKPFINILKNKLGNKKIKLHDIENQFTYIPKDEEDIQALMFYCWLKAKVTNKNFYKTLLETA